MPLGARKKKYWYFLTQIECVLCGRSEQYRERRYTPRPDHASNRYEFIQDACGCHFQ